MSSAAAHAPAADGDRKKAAAGGARASRAAAPVAEPPAPGFWQMAMAGAAHPAIAATPPPGEPDRGTPVVWPKLIVGAPDDAWEREADHVAEHFARGEVGAVTAAPPRVQRMCAACAAGGASHCPHCEEEEARGRGRDPDAGTLRRQIAFGAAAAPSSAFAAPPAAASHIMASRGRGEPLAPQARRTFEPHFGRDLGQVRVHADAPAAETARALSARAFTSGSDIYFGAGQYTPATPAGRQLLAHELTHVVQQGGGAPPGVIRRQPWGPFMQPRTLPRPATGYDPCTPAALGAASSEVVELKGTGVFTPSHDLADAIRCAEPAALGVRVRFGALASGMIYVRRVGVAPPPEPESEGGLSRGEQGALIGFGLGGLPGAAIGHYIGSRADERAEQERRRRLQASYTARMMPGGLYETVDQNPYIDLHHPSLPGAGASAPPRLWLNIRDSVVTGHVEFFPWDRLPLIATPAWNVLNPPERYLGWRGLTHVQPGRRVNELREGVLRYGFDTFDFQLQNDAQLGDTHVHTDDGPRGTGTFLVVDEHESFAATANVEAPGVSGAPMTLEKTAQRIFGAQNLTLTLAPTDLFGGTFSGSLRGTFANGILVVQGTARYRSRKLTGAVTVMLAPRAQAWEHVLRQLPASPNLPNPSARAALRSGLVLVGWGTVDFRLNPWLTGSVSAVLDPDGYITSHGILRPTRTFQFLTDADRWGGRRMLWGPLHAGATFASIWGANINGTVDFELWGGGRIGPATIYGIEVEGTFSTRPGSVFEARVTARANLSAWGRLEPHLHFSLHASLIVDEARAASVDVHVVGHATVRAYVELQPTFERIAGSQPDEAEYRISGHLEAGGAVDVGLSGTLDFSVLGVGPTIHLGEYELPLGRVGMTADFSHVLGSGEPIELSFALTEFNEGRFRGDVHRLVDENERRDRGDHQGQPLSQAAGTVPAETPAHPTELRHQFTMSGVRHTLWVEHTPGPVLKMASDGDEPLTDKLSAEIATVEQERQSAGGEQSDLAAVEASSARTLLRQAETVEASLTAMESEARPNPDIAGATELAAGLHNYGDEFGKTDLAQQPPPVAGGPGTVEVDQNGRYIIRTMADLTALRAARPQRPLDLDAAAEEMWGRYIEDEPNYFDEKLEVVERDLTTGNRRVRHETPFTWAAYTRARGFWDSLRQRKEFQDELRESIIAQHPGYDPSQIEIDVGLQKGNRRVRYADVTVTPLRDGDAAVSEQDGENMEIYSAKVHDVASQVQRQQGNVSRVEDWIEDTMRHDMEEAVDYYGGRVQFRREFRSDASGRVGDDRRAARARGPHPWYEHHVFINRVILVWRSTSTLIPPEYLPFIRRTGNRLETHFRRTIACQLRLFPNE